ncbi:MAG: tetratricopeptide repeat protein [Nitrospirae bacterium]|nr:tetratricopeptide repeat protein [Nitrospirota bacterium]
MNRSPYQAAALALAAVLILPAAIHAKESDEDRAQKPGVKIILPEEAPDFQPQDENGTLTLVRRIIDRLFGGGESESPEKTTKGKPAAEPAKREVPAKPAAPQPPAEEVGEEQTPEEVEPEEPPPLSKQAEEMEKREAKVAEPEVKEVKESFFAKAWKSVRGFFKSTYVTVAGLFKKEPGEAPPESVEPPLPEGPVAFEAPLVPPPAPAVPTTVPPSPYREAPAEAQVTPEPVAVLSPTARPRQEPPPGLQDEVAFQTGYVEFRKDNCRQASRTFAFLLARFPSSPRAGPALYMLGECLYRLGRADQLSGRPRSYKLNYRLATNALRDATLRFPTSPLASFGYYRIVEMRYLGGLYHDVVGMAEYYGKRHPNAPYLSHVRLLEAKAYAHLGQFENSRKAYLHVVYDHPASDQVSEAIFGLANLHANSGEYDESLAYYNEGNKRWPHFLRTHPEASLTLAQAFEKTRFYDEALSLLFFLQGQYGRRNFSDDVQLRIGTTLAHKNDVPNAINAFTRVVNQYPTSPSMPHALLGLADLALERPVRTKLRGGWWSTDEIDPEFLYREIAHRYPLKDVSEASQFKLGMLLYARGRYPEALETLHDVILTYPYGRFTDRAREELSRVFKDGIKSYYESRQFVTVLKLHDAFIESPFLRRAFDMDVLYILGKSFFEMNLHPKAREYLFRVIQKWPPKDVDQHCGYLIGVTYMQEGDYARAEEILRKNVDVDPKGSYVPAILYSLGETTYNLQKYAETVQAFGRYLFTSPPPERAMPAFYYIGNSLYAQRKYLEAAEAYASVLALARKEKLAEPPPYVVEAHYQLADSFFLAGLHDPSLRAYEEAYKLFPEGERGTWAQYRISYLKEILKNPAEALKGYEALATSGDTMWQSISAGLRDFARAREVYRGYFKAPE